MDMKGKAVGSTSFHEGWRNWNKLLAFRNYGQGKRCRECARLDQERLQSTTEPDKMLIANQKRAHLLGIKQDRRIDMRTSEQSNSDALKLSETSSGLLLKLSIDGMDQAGWGHGKLARSPHAGCSS